LPSSSHPKLQPIPSPISPNQPIFSSKMTGGKSGGKASAAKASAQS
jgi:hypothetical protein